MRKVSDFIGKYMAIIVLAVSLLALFKPETCIWIQTGWINYLLMIVMFGMGLTMKAGDFAVVFTRPRDVIIECLAQYLIMPALAFVLGPVFGLSGELLVGVILVGTCPGGTSSNDITYLSKGDTALSVGMTSISTLLAPFLTPILTFLYLRTFVTVDVKSMFISIVQIVLIPIGLGNTEVWFVAIGSDTDLHDGARAFVAEHRDELRGSMVVEVESLGLGELAFASEEGRYRKLKASSRVKRYMRQATAATGISPSSVSLSGSDSITTVLQKAGCQTMHLFGEEGGRPALKGSADDVLENVDELTLDENVNFLLELVKRG